MVDFQEHQRRGELVGESPASHGNLQPFHGSLEPGCFMPHYCRWKSVKKARMVRLAGRDPLLDFQETGGCGSNESADRLVLYAKPYEEATIGMLKSTDAGKTWPEGPTDYQDIRASGKRRSTNDGSADPNMLYACLLWPGSSRAKIAENLGSHQLLRPERLERLVSTENPIPSTAKGSRISGEGRGAEEQPMGEKIVRTINTGLPIPSRGSCLLVDRPIRAHCMSVRHVAVFQDHERWGDWAPTGSTEQITSTEAKRSKTVAAPPGRIALLPRPIRRWRWLISS